jgi:hypothetical protein
MQDMPRTGTNETAHHPQLIGVFADRAAVLGGLLLFAICGYRRIWHPEWSGAEAMAMLWPVYVVGGLPILTRWAIAQSWGLRTAEWAMAVAYRNRRGDHNRRANAAEQH